MSSAADEQRKMVCEYFDMRVGAYNALTPADLAFWLKMIDDDKKNGTIRGVPVAIWKKCHRTPQEKTKVWASLPKKTRAATLRGLEAGIALIDPLGSWK